MYISLLILCTFVLIIHVDGLDYFIYGPKTISSHSSYPVSILCRQASPDSDEVAADSADAALLNEKVTIKFIIEADQKTVLDKVVIVQPDKLETIFLPVGELNPGATIRLKVAGSDSDFFHNTAHLSIERSLKPAKKYIFIQTDKPLYKGGDTVKFRILTVDQQLLPVSLPLQIHIKNAQGNIIKQYLNPIDTNVTGYFAGELLLSKEPVLGQWKIEAQNSNANVKQTKEFSVDEYVLPRFDARILAPNYITPRDTDFFISFEANYTFGEPVTGLFNISIVGPGRQSGEIEYADDDEDTMMIQKFLNYSSINTNGRSTINIATAAMLYPGRTYDARDKLEIYATFTETLTGVSRNATTIVVPIINQPYKLTLTSSGSDTFLPGFPFTFRATVLDLNNRPLVPDARTVLLTISFYDQRGSTRIGGGKIVEELFVKVPDGWNQESDYEWDDASENRDNIVFARVGIDGSVSTEIPTPINARRMLIEAKYGNDEQNVTINGRESPSNSFIQITPFKSDLHAEDTAIFGINMTTHDDEMLQYTVTSSSNNSYSWSNSTTVSGNYTEIVIPADKSMGISGRLLVFYIRADREVVAAISTINNSPSMRSNVIITANPKNGADYAKPGEEATVQVKTTPFSFVGFLAMDESLLLMKTGNDISQSDVINVLESGEGISYSDLFSAKDYFEKSSLFVLTNQNVPTSTEPLPGNGFSSTAKNAKMDQIIDDTESEGSPQQNFPESTQSLLSSTTTPTVAGTGKQKITFKSPARLRKDFRESFLFDTVFASDSGVAEIKSAVPDAITTWRISAFSLSESTGLRVSEQAARLKVFQPFFVVLNLPFSVIRGENLTFDIMVFNYMSIDQNVSVKLEALEGSSSKNTWFKMVTAKSGQGAVIISSEIIPEVIGDLTLKVTATSEFAADQIEKKLLVKPEGVKQYFNRPVFIDLRYSETFTTQVQFPANPAGLVAGSDKVEVNIVGDILGPAINNLDQLIRLPTGCGEQNMALTAPNVVVAEYLQAFNQMTSNRSENLLANIRLGYQREFNYRHKDNSYSAWGQSDPKGSTWLTAYVARVFLKAEKFIEIEDDVIKTALRYLIDQQNPDGSFEENGKIVDKEYQGGAACGAALTAFTLLPFIEYSKSRTSIVKQFQESINRAISNLESQIPKLRNDVYALAVTAYALVSANSQRSADILDELDLHAMQSDPSKTFWSTDAQWNRQDTIQQYKTNPKDIEATSYALLAYMAANRRTKAFSITSWLLSKQNSNGGFVSTQDTVVGLMALGEFAKLSMSPPDIDFTVQNADSVPHGVKVTPDNFLVLARQIFACKFALAICATELAA